MNELLNNGDGAFKELIQCLEHEVKLYNQLGDLLKAKQSNIIKGDVESLQNNVHEEQRLIPKIRTATRARELRAATIAAVSKMSCKTPSLMELIDLTPSHYSQQLIEYREHLILRLDQIAHANRENEFLLNSSLELVRGLVQVLLGKAENENIHYGGHGQVYDDQTHNARVDCQV
ncbi:MAG: flagellar protein FlgN [Candidatus Marinimicrobia bacterium]|nr:flagellar protein FlgN [Candidatus Neomarinimicrobiota bacterium]